MEKKADFQGDHLSEEASGFSQLLFGDDRNDVGLHVDQRPLHCSRTPIMLCFGSHQDEHQLFLSETHTTPQKSVVTCSDSSSVSTCSNHRKGNANANCSSKSNKRRNGDGPEPEHCSSSVSKPAVASQRTSKKTKAGNPSSISHAKRKEKLGERIAALQQLVSPFGKTDTASVLHEAMGYIKFLHDRVSVLCSPYLQCRPSLPHGRYPRQSEDLRKVGEDTNKDLSRRGLCLVPVECTLHVASSNGADFWSPAMEINHLAPSTTKG